jgi:hypothetical protein
MGTRGAIIMDKVQEKTKQPVTKDEKLDDALDDSFPASDPPSQTDPQRSIKKKKPLPDADHDATARKAGD